MAKTKVVLEAAKWRRSEAKVNSYTGYASVMHIFFWYFIT